MSDIRICVECKWHNHNSIDPNTEMHVCNHPTIERHCKWQDPVTGFVTYKSCYCAELRQPYQDDRAICGFGGKWFEPKEAK